MTTMAPPRRVEIVVPLVPPSCLLPNAARRTDYRVKARESRILRDGAAWSALERIQDPHRGPTLINGPVIVTMVLRWPKGRQMPDCDALAHCTKAILDGIVDAGVIEGDGPTVVKEVRYRQERAVGVGETVVMIAAWEAVEDVDAARKEMSG